MYELRNSHKIRAFSLLEILLSIVLIILGVLSVVQVMSLAMNMDKITEQQGIALSLAQEALENCKNVSTFSSLTTLCAQSSATVTDFSDYTRSVTVDTSATTYDTVTSTVTWQDTKGYSSKTLTVSLITVLTRNCPTSYGC